MELAHYRLEWRDSLLAVLKLVIILSQSDWLTFCGKFWQQMRPKFAAG